MLIGECLPKNHKVPFDIVNRLLTKKDIGDVIDQVCRHTGQKDTVLFADAIMALGFRHAFQAGISFGKDDMIIPESKVGTVDETRALVADYEQQYQDGLRSEEHTSELQSLMRISYAVFCLKKKKQAKSQDKYDNNTT